MFRVLPELRLVKMHHWAPHLEGRCSPNVVIKLQAKQNDPRQTCESRQARGIQAWFLTKMACRLALEYCKSSFNFNLVSTLCQPHQRAGVVRGVVTLNRPFTRILSNCQHQTPQKAAQPPKEYPAILYQAHHGKICGKTQSHNQRRDYWFIHHLHLDGHPLNWHALQNLK